MAVTLLTGCSSGFGQALAAAFAARGGVVVATVRRPEAAQALRALERASPGRVDVLPLDVTDPASRAAAVTAVLARHGRVDVLVNNAGVLHLGAAEDTPEAAARAVFETNYFGAVALTHAVLPGMRDRGSGRVVNVTAIGAVLATPFLSAYCASKHALDAAGACMDVELRPFGVRVSSVLPGSFRTDIGRAAGVRQDSPAYAPHAEAFRQAFLGRLAAATDDLTDVVAAVVHAATAAAPQARYVVGGGAAHTVRPVVDALAALHEAELARAGTPPA